MKKFSRSLLYSYIYTYESISLHRTINKTDNTSIAYKLKIRTHIQITKTIDQLKRAVERRKKLI